MILPLFIFAVIYVSHVNAMIHIIVRVIICVTSTKFKIS